MFYSLSMIIFPMLAFTLAMMVLLFQFSHLLMSLFCLEAMMLCMVLFIPLSASLSTIFMPQISMILLTFGACEASLGLSIMVMMSRSYGSDMVNILNMNKC